jgi:hypothetical protein
MPVCEVNNASSSIQFEKVSEKCSDISLLWDISFGVAVAFDIEVNCGPDCDGELIFYNIDEVLKTPEGIIPLGNSNSHFAYYECNQMTMRTQAFNTPVEDDNPDPIEYNVGDTLQWSFFDPRKCLSQDRTECFFDNEIIDLPDFTFEYIIKADDFDCD